MKKNKTETNTNPRHCPGSKKQIHDVTFSERFSGTVFCGECCSALHLPKDAPTVTLPDHEVPSRLVAWRKRFDKE
jgi:hypothetical protein